MAYNSSVTSHDCARFLAFGMFPPDHAFFIVHG